VIDGGLLEHGLEVCPRRAWTLRLQSYQSAAPHGVCQASVTPRGKRSLCVWCRKDRWTGMLGVYLAAAEPPRRGALSSLPTSRSAIRRGPVGHGSRVSAGLVPFKVKTNRKGRPAFLVDRPAHRTFLSPNHTSTFLSTSRATSGPDYLVVGQCLRR